MHSNSPFLLLLPLVALFFAGSAEAQATRTWVSGVGDDANPCSRTAPCKTLAGAISKTAAGGEINLTDAGGVGAVTITKAITIDATNTVGGVLAANVNGVVISAGPNDAVVLRGLERDRSRRWRDLEEFRQALLPFVPGQLSMGSMGFRIGAYMLDYLFMMLLNVPVNTAMTGGDMSFWFDQSAVIRMLPLQLVGLERVDVGNARVACGLQFER